jgi:hypothetical protein
VRLRREAADAEREHRLLSRAASHAGNTVPRRRSEEVYRTSERDGTCTSPLFSALLFSLLFSSPLILYHYLLCYIISFGAAADIGRAWVCFAYTRLQLRQCC